MEQWNNLDNSPEEISIFDCMMKVIKDVYDDLKFETEVFESNDNEFRTLYSFLRGKYIYEYMRDTGKPSNYLKKNNIRKINKDIEQDCYQTFEIYKKTPLRRLEKMLRIILGDEYIRFKDSRKQAVLTRDNCQFFKFFLDIDKNATDDSHKNFMVDTGETDNTSLFLSEKYDDLDDWYIYHMLNGIIGLLNNKKLGFDPKLIDKWMMRLSKPYRDMKDAVDELDMAATRLGMAVTEVNSTYYSKNMLEFYISAKEEIVYFTNRLIDMGTEIFRNSHEEGNEEMEQLINNFPK